ncbi:uncharacterized protein [Chamaea fasciata]|uniref:uncharacterized protein n=1 Tax=Chamaea fasciata TaxID=190680 RepID=UPI00336A2E92
MEPREVLELLVAPVATLGKLAATVTAPRRRVRPLLYPESLHADLRRFTWRLRDTLDHGNVTSLHRCGVTPLGQALAALKATPGATRDNVRAAARAWWELMFVFEDRWARLSWESRRLLNTMEDKAIAEAITEDTNEATTTGLAREEAVVATRQAGVATKREERMEEAWELLEQFLDACDEAIVFPWKLLHQLWYIKAAVEGAEEVSPDVPKALVTMVAKAELLWEASAHLTTCHLLPPPRPPAPRQPRGIFRQKVQGCQNLWSFARFMAERSAAARRAGDRTRGLALPGMCHAMVWHGPHGTSGHMSQPCLGQRHRHTERSVLQSGQGHHGDRATHCHQSL